MSFFRPSCRGRGGAQARAARLTTSGTGFYDCRAPGGMKAMSQWLVLNTNGPRPSGAHGPEPRWALPCPATRGAHGCQPAPTSMNVSTVSSAVTSGCSQPLSFLVAASPAAAAPSAAAATAASARSAKRCAAASASVNSCASCSSARTVCACDAAGAAAEAAEALCRCRVSASCRPARPAAAAGRSSSGPSSAAARSCRLHPWAQQRWWRSALNCSTAYSF